jgi:hypothetical protein
MQTTLTKQKQTAETQAASGSGGPFSQAEMFSTANLAERKLES